MNYNEVLTYPGIHRLVHHNAQVQPGETAVVVTDYVMEQYAAPLAATLRAAGADVTVCVMAPTGGDGNEPPAPVAAAMKTADVIFSPVSTSVTHTRAMRAALEEGARAILMTHHNHDVLTAPSLLVTDFGVIRDLCLELGERLSQATTIRVYAAGGTDITFELVPGRKVNVLTGQPGPGELAPVPTIEVNVVPKEGTAVGRIVADCSLPYLGIGVLREPIECIVEEGFITTVTGGEQAEVLAADWAARNDKNVYNVAELGIGLNPNARPTGVMLEDEGIVGTVHFGIGTSRTLGGTIQAPTHYDLLVWNPIIEADGVVLYDKNRIAN